MKVVYIILTVFPMYKIIPVICTVTLKNKQRSIFLNIWATFSFKILEIPEKNVLNVIDIRY